MVEAFGTHLDCGQSLERLDQLRVKVGRPAHHHLAGAKRRDLAGHTGRCHSLAQRRFAFDEPHPSGRHSLPQLLEKRSCGGRAKTVIDMHAAVAGAGPQAGDGQCHADARHHVDQRPGIGRGRTDLPFGPMHSHQRVWGCLADPLGEEAVGLDFHADFIGIGS